MPDNLRICVFAFGAVLILVALLGGNFKLFGAEVASTVSNPILRFLALALGALLIALAIQVYHFSEASAPPPLSSPSNKSKSPEKSSSFPDSNKKDPRNSGRPQQSADHQQPSLSPRVPESVSPRELSGSITLSKREGALGVCVRINGFPNGLPSSHAPVFHAWMPGSAVDIPMILGDDETCKNGYTLQSAAPAISQGGTMRIYENSQPLDCVNVGSFTVAGSQGCLDVGRVESFTINWMKSGNREKASTSGIPVNGDYGWVCKA
jgi:hypothetical protein